MWLLRLLAVLLGIALAVCGLLYLLTRNPCYLWLAKRMLSAGVMMALLVFSLLFVERLALIPGW